MDKPEYDKDLRRIFAEYANYFTLPVATTEAKGDIYTQLPRDLFANLMLKEAYLLGLINKGALSLRALREDCDRFHEHAEDDFKGKANLEQILLAVNIPKERWPLYLPKDARGTAQAAAPSAPAGHGNHSILPLIIGALLACVAAYFAGFDAKKPPVVITIDVPPLPPPAPPTATPTAIIEIIELPTPTPVPYVAPPPKPRPRPSRPLKPKPVVRRRPVRKPVVRKPVVQKPAAQEIEVETGPEPSQAAPSEEVYEE